MTYNGLLSYSAAKATADSVEIVRLRDPGHGIELSIAPSIGNIAFDMRVNGKPMLLAPAAKLSDWKARPSQAGIPFLAPWANRLDGDAYWANGKRYVLNPDAATVRRDGNGLPIHGLLLYASEWRIARLHADDRAAELACRLEFFKHPALIAQFPFAHSIDMTYRLSNGELEVRTAIANHAAEPMPLSVGYHPWFQIPDSPRDAWQLHLPVRQHYTLSSRLIPTGATEPVGLPDPVPLAGRQIDDVFGAILPNDEFRVEGAGRRISVRFGPKFPIAVVYAPQGQNVVCFEPMTGITNAFNLAHAGVYQNLPSIAPGEIWTESFWIKPSGF